MRAKDALKEECVRNLSATASRAPRRRAVGVHGSWPGHFLRVFCLFLRPRPSCPPFLYQFLCLFLFLFPAASRAAPARGSFLAPARQAVRVCEVGPRRSRLCSGHAEEGGSIALAASTPPDVGVVFLFSLYSASSKALFSLLRKQRSNSMHPACHDSLQDILRLYAGSRKALFRLSSPSTEALLRLY